jgi:putative acetyltransferase
MAATAISTFRTSDQHPAFRELIPFLDAELSLRYGEEQKTYDQFNILHQVDTVVVAFADGIPIGCGCFKQYNDKTAEIKRMYVSGAHRGKGVARKILQELEAWASELHYNTAVLETGAKQPEAIALYEKMGYHRIENFRPYKGMPLSICYGKNIQVETPIA